MLPHLTARERILGAADHAWHATSGSGSENQACASNIAAAVEALRIARELMRDKMSPYPAYVKADRVLDDLLTVLVGGSQVEESKDFSAALLPADPSASVNTEALPTYAYLLYENFFNGKAWRESLERVALNPEDARAWVQADFPEGYSRTSIRIFVFTAPQVGSVSESAEQHSVERTGAQRHDPTLTFASPEAPRDEKEG